MVPVVSFIGWHDSGKTTLVKDVVAHLKKLGLRVAVCKSTKHTGIEFDRQGTDTDIYRQAGADAVTLIAPDLMILTTANPEMSLIDLVYRYFHDYDIVIGEGFKHERKINKIEVIRGDAELLRDQVTNVVATVADRRLSGDHVFKPEQSREIAEFIVARYIENPRARKENTLLLVNGKKVPMKGFVQDALAGTIHGFVKTLKQTDGLREIEVKIKLDARQDQ